MVRVGGARKTYRNLTWEHLAKCQLGRRMENRIKVDKKELGCKDENWMKLAQVRVHCGLWRYCL